MLNKILNGGWELELKPELESEPVKNVPPPQHCRPYPLLRENVDTDQKSHRGKPS